MGSGLWGIAKRNIMNALLAISVLFFLFFKTLCDQITVWFVNTTPSSNILLNGVRLPLVATHE